MMHLRVAAIACAIVALAGCHRDIPSHASAATAPPVALPAEPAAPAWTANDLRSVRTHLAAAFAAAPFGAAGIAILDGDARPLYVRRERRAMTPASTFKCLVAAASLATLGPDHRFTTTIEAASEPRDGRIGDVYVVGGGDPMLTRDDVRGAAAQVARSGARRIDGDVVVDASAFAGPEVNPAWDPDDLQYGYAAGVSALSIDGGTLDFKVVGTTPGLPARIVADPPSDDVHVAGSVTTSYATSLAIERAPAQNDFTFSGRVAAGAEPEFWQPVTDQPRYVGGVVRHALRAHDVEVTGDVKAGVAPVASLALWTHRSPPLREIVKKMLWISDNHIAETLLRDLAAERGTGTVATGDAVERAVLRRENVPVAGLRIVDGSGLAASDRIMPLTLAALLARAAREPFGRVLVGALPRVGLEGTVRWHGVTDARGRARAKSGHIGGVNALAGYVDTAHHGRVAFAVIVNGPQADAGAIDAGIDRALDVLARS